MTTALLPTIWFGLLGLILALYVMLDGFDLGVGIFSLFAGSEEERGIMMGSLGSVWDANETWLVLFGGMIFGAFPIAYGMVMSALYLPLVVMLVGLIFRAISFDFRAHSERKALWSKAFGWGSLVAALCQGLAFGGLVGGIEVSGLEYVGSGWDWLNPFAIVAGLELVSGYLLLGSLYLNLKTEGALQARARKTAVRTAFAAVLFAATTTIWVPWALHSGTRPWRGDCDCSRPWGATPFVRPIILRRPSCWTCVTAWACSWWTRHSMNGEKGGPRKTGGWCAGGAGGARPGTVTTCISTGGLKKT